MRIAVFCFISFSSIVNSFGQGCFLKTDTVYFFSAITEIDWGTNGITPSLDSLKLSFDTKANFFCSFVSSLSYSHAFDGSLTYYIENEVDRNKYSKCIELEKSSRLDAKSLRLIHNNYRDYRIRLKDGTDLLVSVIKITAVMLAYERDNRFIPQPVAKFDEACYKSKWSYIYYRNLNRLKFESKEIEFLDRVFNAQRRHTTTR